MASLHPQTKTIIYAITAAVTRDAPIRQWQLTIGRLPINT